MPSIFEALQNFAASVTSKMTQLTSGEAEDQLWNPFETFMGEVANHLGWNVVCIGETPPPDTGGDELPVVPDEMRKPPKAPRRTGQSELPFG